MSENKALWDLKDLLRGRTIKEIETKIQKDVETFTTYRKILTDSITAEKLKEIIELKEKIIFDLDSLESYFGLQFTIDTNNQKVLAKMTYYDRLGTEIGNKMIFFSLWFMHLEDATAKKLISSKILQDYKYYLEEVRKAKPYVKDEATEKILSIKNMTSGAFGQLYDIFTNSFTYSIEDKKNITQDELKQYVYNKDPKKRAEAYEKLFSPYKENLTFMNELYKNIVLDWCNEGIQIRGHKKSISIRDMNNDIDDKAVQTLLCVVKKNNNLFQEYFKLRRAINEKNGQTYDNNRYHIYTPFAGEVKKTYTYEEGKALVLDTYKKFDERFYTAAKEIFDANHVHSHPQKGKRSGAFCSSLGGLVKPYILLNHNGSVRDVFTIMHELGHGIHSILAEKQKPLLMHAALPMAETASIMGEMILADRLLKESKDEKEKTSILMQLLDNEWASITRQAYFVLFEEAAHKKIMKGVTSNELDKIYMSMLKEQFGDMEIPESFAREWNYIPHIHHTPFYCYAYTWGNLLVLSLYDQYKKKGKSFIEKLVTMLSNGGSKRPQDILTELGMDPTKESFWEAGFIIIKEQVEELKKITGN